MGVKKELKWTLGGIELKWELKWTLGGVELKGELKREIKWTKVLRLITNE